MGEIDRKTIELPEICRVEGHSAVTVDIEDNKVKTVQLNVFEGTRFFERIVIDHHYAELPHITSRVCAICSTGHVIAAAHAIEHIFHFVPSQRTKLFRELMHLGMIIESHATHICALALPDFLDTPDLMDFADKHAFEFGIWNSLRSLGALIQTTIGGRPFHPVNLQVGHLSSYPSEKVLAPLLKALDENIEKAIYLHDLLSKFPLPINETANCAYLALIPEEKHYGFFGRTILSSDGWQSTIDDYKKYLSEIVVPHSHAKQSRAGGKPFMVGAMARLNLFGERLGSIARPYYERSSMRKGDKNTIWNNLAQSIEIIEAIDKAKQIISELIAIDKSAGEGVGSISSNKEEVKLKVKSGKGVGAVECPRGTLYHFYEVNENGKVLAADMITPSAQNTAHIEEDIKVVTEAQLKEESTQLQKNLETLVRAYDPCNTCATHMVEIRFSRSNQNGNSGEK